MATTHNMKKMAGKALLSGGVALAALGMASGTAHAFNPTPEPPGEPQITAPGLHDAFNPQPDPPGRPRLCSPRSCDGSV